MVRRAESPSVCTTAAKSTTFFSFLSFSHFSKVKFKEGLEKGWIFLSDLELEETLTIISYESLELANNLRFALL